MAKKKLILTMLAFNFILIAAVATVVFAFALSQHSITTSLNIGYVVEDIDGTASAKFTVGGVTRDLVAIKDGKEIEDHTLRFNAGDTENTGNLMFPEDAPLALTAENDNVVIEYTYTNTGSKHYIASMAFDAALEYENMEVEYSINGIDYSTQRYAVVVKAYESKSYFIRIGIDKKEEPANFNGEFNWLLSGCDPQSSDYLTLASIEIQQTGTANTFSISITGDGEYGSLVIPSEVNGVPVKAMASSSSLSLEKKAQIKSVYIPNSIETLGNNAFSSFANLENVTFEQNVQSIKDGYTGLTTLGEYVFYGCKSLKSLDLPTTIESIGKGSFYGCTSLTSFELPINVATIGNTLFTNCTNLKSIKLSESMNTLTYAMFQGCTSLESLVIPRGITTFETQIFNNCTSLQKFTLDNVSKDFTDKLKSVVTNLTNLEIDIFPGVTEIPDRAFQQWTNLKSVKIPSTVTTIGYASFYKSSIQKITIPNSVTSIGGYAFEQCTSLKEITIPSSVATIDIGAFVGCSRLESVQLLAEIVDLPSRIFEYCTSLTQIVLPNSIKNINSKAFDRCYALKSVTLPNKLETLNGTVFSSCTALESITLPETLRQVDQGAFTGCTNLTKVTTHYLNDSIAGAIKRIQPAEGGYEVVIGYGVTTIPEKAFYVEGMERKISKVEIPSTVTTIGPWAFYECTLLEKVVIPSSVTTVGDAAFYHTGLKSVEIKEGLEELSTHMFKNCSSLTSVKLPNSLKTIGSRAFESCTSLEYINLPSGLQNIGGYAFTLCGLREIEIPATVTKISQYAFSSCSVLTDIKLNNGLKEMEAGVFKNCENLNNIILPSSLEIIRAYVFENTKVVSVIIPSSVYMVGKAAFSHALMEITFEDPEGWYLGSSSESTAEESEAVDVANYITLLASMRSEGTYYHFLKKPVV